jgi:hypothetical protein
MAVDGENSDRDAIDNEIRPADVADIDPPRLYNRDESPTFSWRA